MVIFVGKAVRLHTSITKEERIIGIHKSNRFPLQATAINVIGTGRQTYPAMVTAVQPSLFFCCRSQKALLIRDQQQQVSLCELLPKNFLIFICSFHRRMRICFPIFVIVDKEGEPSCSGDPH
jgi:hypothetical protein